jgi:hypothetical protein
MKPLSFKILPLHHPPSLLHSLLSAYHCLDSIWIAYVCGFPTRGVAQGVQHVPTIRETLGLILALKR